MKKLIKILTAISLIAGMASCGSSEAGKDVYIPPAMPAYKTMRLEPRQISGKVQLPGVMQPYQFVQLFPKINGFVKNVAVDRGSLVRRGQSLITLDAPEVEQAVAAAKLRYTQAEASYITSKDRYRRMKETSLTPGTISPYDLEAAASKMAGDSATAQGEYANFRAQEAMKGYLTISAPFDGVITERNVHPGALAGPGSQNAKPLLVLQQLSRLRLMVDVPEQYSGQVKNGDTVHYFTNALPGQVFTGTVSRSSQSLTNSYRSEAMEIDVDNEANRFKPGMYAEVVLPTSGNTNAFVVPKSAVVTTTEKKYVVVVDNSAAHLIDISVGNEGGDSTEIFGNMHPGSEVVVNATYQIKEGSKIK